MEFKSLERTDYPNYEIVFVGNASDDGSADAVKSTFQRSV